jgi:hypothetical protein
MDNLYEQLGFKQPKILMNHYGIKIYVGTEGKDDWCVVIPNWLVRSKRPCFINTNDFALYLVSEQEALELAKEYTEHARKMKG